MKVAAIQLHAGSNKAENIKLAVALVRQAIGKKAKLIVLPEVFSFQGLISSMDELKSVAESIPGESTRPFMDLARHHKVFIVAGSVYEKISRSNKAYNTATLINDRGRIAGKYRKIHLFEAAIGDKKVREAKNFIAGEKIVLKNIKGFNVGFSICYDLRFPRLFEAYAKKGAHIMCVPSVFTEKTGQAHWEVLLRSRAIENLCYVIAPNQYGDNGRGIANYGHSMIVDPWGRVLSESKRKADDIIYANLKMEVLAQSRKILPSIFKPKFCIPL